MDRSHAESGLRAQTRLQGQSLRTASRVAADSVAADLDGLRSGGRYDVRVQALNGNGTSNSNEVTVTLPFQEYTDCKPTAPLITFEHRYQNQKGRPLLRHSPVTACEATTSAILVRDRAGRALPSRLSANWRRRGRVAAPPCRSWSATGAGRRRFARMLQGSLSMSQGRVAKTGNFSPRPAASTTMLSPVEFTSATGIAPFDFGQGLQVPVYRTSGSFTEANVAADSSVEAGVAGISRRAS